MEQRGVIVAADKLLPCQQRAVWGLKGTEAVNLSKQSVGELHPGYNTQVWCNDQLSVP